METFVLKCINQCRICLEYDETMLNLFDDTSATYKLEQCCGVEIVNIPNMPAKICKKCFDILNVAYDFRVLCQRSQEYLSHQQIAADIEDHKPSLSEIDLAPYISMDEDVIEYVQDDIKYTNEEEEEPSDSAEILQEQAPEEKVIALDDEFEIFDRNECDEKIDGEEKSEDEDKSECDQQKSTLQIEKKGSPRWKEFKTRAPKRSKFPQRPKSPQTFMCNICGNLYKNKAAFTYHMKLHQNDKKYECEICQKRFMQTCELRAHIRTHTGEKPFKCNYCDRKFRDRSGVTRHQRTHTNERPFGCALCGAHFTYSATLKKHERVHTGEKPYKCMICNKQFSEQHQLKAHLTTIRHRELASEQNKVVLLFEN